MRQISSNWTAFHKKLLPIVFFVGWTFLTAYWVLLVVMQQRSAYTLIIPPLVAAWIYLITRLYAGVADEVIIDGDDLVVRNGQLVDRFPLDNIDTIELLPWPANPERILLNLKRPCAFGKTVAFAAEYRMWPFGSHPIAQELISLVIQKENEMASAITSARTRSTDFTAGER